MYIYVFEKKEEEDLMANLLTSKEAMKVFIVYIIMFILYCPAF
jgi:hypothetical protein